MVRVYCAHGDSILLTAFYLWASVPRGAAFPQCKPSRVRARNDIAPRAAVGSMACVLIQSTVRGAEALNRHLWRSYDLQRPSSSLPESAGTPKSDPPSWLRGCQALPQPRRPHEPHPSRRSHAHTRTPTWHVSISARAERRTSGFPSLSSSSVNVVVMQMPHGHPSSLRRQKAG